MLISVITIYVIILMLIILVSIIDHRRLRTCLNLCLREITFSMIVVIGNDFIAHGGNFM